MTARLAVEHLTVAYAGVPAVREASVVAEPGQLVALLGPNGAGKTSLLTTIAGLRRPVSGGVRLGDLDLTGRPAQAVARAGLRLVPEGRALFPDLSVWDNLRVGAGAVRRDELARRTGSLFEIFPVLATRRAQPAGLLSGGEQQMLSIARALVARPTVLLLDEPSMGLAPRVVADIIAVVARLRDEGLTLVVAEQNARAVLPVADHAVLLARGRVQAEGSPADIGALLAESGYLGNAVRPLVGP